MPLFLCSGPDAGGATEREKHMKKIIELKNISKAFDGEVVLDNISLHIASGETVGVIGGTGS